MSGPFAGIVFLVVAVIAFGSLLHLLQAVVPLVIILVTVAILGRMLWHRL